MYNVKKLHIHKTYSVSLAPFSDISLPHSISVILSSDSDTLGNVGSGSGSLGVALVETVEDSRLFSLVLMSSISTLIASISATIFPLSDSLSTVVLLSGCIEGFGEERQDGVHKEAAGVTG